MERILISRFDAIGDVVLTIPMCGALKQLFPSCKIYFLGRTYTQPIIACCQFVDEFVNADDLLKMTSKDAIAFIGAMNLDAVVHVSPNKTIAKLMKLAGVGMRIGTSHRLFHWGTVNYRVNLGRKNSLLHEAQLNFALLVPFSEKFKQAPTFEELISWYGFSAPSKKGNLNGKNDLGRQLLLAKVDELLAWAGERKKIILHPLSNASAREWSIAHFIHLIDLLDTQTYAVFISGTKQDGERLNSLLVKELGEDGLGKVAGKVAKEILDEMPRNISGEVKTIQKRLPEHVKIITGDLNLTEFIELIAQSDALVAASTGPLHIAAALGIGAIGIYPPMRPIHPGRWRPIGRKAKYVCLDKQCMDCKKTPQSCACMQAIDANQVFKVLQTTVQN